jgi:hypothetical protein
LITSTQKTLVGYLRHDRYIKTWPFFNTRIHGNNENCSQYLCSNASISWLFYQIVYSLYHVKVCLLAYDKGIAFWYLTCLDTRISRWCCNSLHWSLCCCATWWQTCGRLNTDSRAWSRSLPSRLPVLIVVIGEQVSVG